MTATLYHMSMYDTGAVPSYWEASFAARPQLGEPLHGSESCDVAIIGGGYTGLSAALHLARDFDGDVRVLEAGHIGWGASGRNGGFCILPAAKLSVKQMVRRYGADETARFWTAQRDGADLTRALAQESPVDCDITGDGILEVAHRPSAYAELQDYGDDLRKFGIESDLYPKEAFARFAYDSQEQFGGLHVKCGFGLHPLKFAIGLGALAQQAGAKLHPYSEVYSWQKDGGTHLLYTRGGCIRARKVLIATNGFTKDGLHSATDKRLVPVMSNIIVTRPLSDGERAAQQWQTYMPAVNTRNLLFYYRMLPDNRFLFGARGDTTGTFEDGQRMRAYLTRRLGEVFPGWRDVDIDYFWRGFVLMTRKMAPSMGWDREDPSVFFSYGYHANGVNTAPWAGRAMARWIAGEKDAEASIPAILKGAPPRIPFANLRLWYLRAMLALYRWQDD